MVQSGAGHGPVDKAPGCCKVALGSNPQPSTPKMGSSKVDEQPTGGPTKIRGWIAPRKAVELALRNPKKKKKKKRVGPGPLDKAPGCCKVALGSNPQPSTPNMGSSKVDEQPTGGPTKIRGWIAPRKSS